MASGKAAEGYDLRARGCKCEAEIGVSSPGGTRSGGPPPRRGSDADASPRSAVRRARTPPRRPGSGSNAAAQSGSAREKPLEFDASRPLAAAGLLDLGEEGDVRLVPRSRHRP